MTKTNNIIIQYCCHVLFYFFFSNANCYAQKYNNPMFDRADTTSFRIQQVELRPDYTILHCKYYAERNSWTNISRNSYIEDVASNEKLYLKRITGLLYSPQKKYLKAGESIQVSLYFPRIRSKRFNFIDAKKEKNLCIYGINIDTIPFQTEYIKDEVLRKVETQKQLSDSSDYSKSIKLSKELVGEFKYLYGIRSQEVFERLCILSCDYYYLGDFRNAINCVKEALSIGSSHQEFEKEKLIEAQSILSVYYNDIGNYQKAISILSNIVPSIIEIYGEESKEYSEAIIKLSKYSNNIGDYGNGLQYAIKAKEIIIKKLGEENDTYVRCLSNLAIAKSNIGEYEEAIRINLKGYHINSLLFGSYNVDNAIFLGNASYNYSMLGKYEEAIEYGKKACQLYKYNNVNNESYVVFLSNISLYYFQLASKILKEKSIIRNEYLKEIQLYCDSAEIVANRLIEKNTVLPLLRNNKAFMFSLQNDYEKAINEYIEACSLYEDKTSLEYATYLGNLALTYLQYGRHKLAIETEVEANNIFHTKIKNTLFTLSKATISDYKNTLDDWYINLIPRFALHTKDSIAISLLYNESILFYKGLLLNLCKDNIKESIKKDISWQQIKDALNDNEIAIELIKCPIGQTNDRQSYLAITLKKEFNIPHLTHICYEDEMTSINYEQIWETLKNELQGVTIIYFSPDGIFKNIDNKFMTLQKFGLFSKMFTIKRIESTYELVNQ